MRCGRRNLALPLAFPKYVYPPCFCPLSQVPKKYRQPK